MNNFLGEIKLYVDFNNMGNILVVKLTGELDHHSAEAVRNKIDDKIDGSIISKVILDFSNVNFMDSSGIGVVIGRYKKLSLKNGTLCITNAKESVKRIFELSGLFKIIKLYKTIDEAINTI